MKRMVLVAKEVEECVDCPFFGGSCWDGEDGEDMFIDECTKFGFIEKFIYTDEEVQREKALLKEWFEKKCDFEKIG